MKKIVSVLFFVLAFSLTASAQQAKKGPQEEPKKENCCANHANASAEEIAKCKAKAASCTKDEKAKASCTTTHTCITDGSCCAGKNPPKKG